MDYYHYSVELPFSRKTINFREFTTEEQLALGKAQHSFSNDPKSHYLFVYDIVSNCVSNSINLKNIDVIEYLLFFIKLRIISVGPKLELSTMIDGQTTKITLDLNILMQNIYSMIESISNDLLVDTNKKIKIGFPKILDMVELISASTNIQAILNTLPLFIEKAGIITNCQDMKKFFDKLPVSLTNSIQTKIFDMLNTISTKEIFNIDIFRDFRINFYDNSIFDIIKILASYDIKSIHQEIYMLSHLTPSYIKSITPSERRIYMSFLAQERAPKDKTEPALLQSKNLSPVEKLAEEFGQIPLNSESSVVNT